MPSTLVHVAVAGLLASALLGEAFGKKSLAIVVVVASLADLDAFISYGGVSGHRVVLHNIWVPVVGAILVWVIIHSDSFDWLPSGVQSRLPEWGEWEARVAWVAIVCYVFAHLLPDLVDGSINLFWPLSDQFYKLDGAIELSDQRGLVQTFSDGGIPLLESRGSLEDVRITTGVDPGTTDDGRTAERLFPLFRAGWELGLFVIGTVVTTARFLVPYHVDDQ